MRSEKNADGEQLLRELGSLSWEEEGADAQRLDARWQALCEGALSATEEEALRREVDGEGEGVGAPWSPLREAQGDRITGGEVVEAFKPLGENFRDSMVDLIQAEIKPEEEPGDTIERSKPVERVSPSPEERILRHKSSPSRRRGSVRRRRFLRSIGLVAAGLFAIFGLNLLRPTEAPSPLPQYEWQVLKSTQEQRGAQGETSAAVPRLASGNELELALRPAEILQQPVQLDLMWQRGDAVYPWRGADPVIAPNTGAFRITVRREDELDLGAGEWTLWALIGGSSRPTERQLQEALEQGHPETLRDGPWRLLEQRVIFLE